jgi:hypothetical protein
MGKLSAYASPGRSRSAGYSRLYFVLSLVTAGVALGLAHKVTAKLICPPYPRPILYLHVGLFMTWVQLSIVEAWAHAHRGHPWA